MEHARWPAPRHRTLAVALAALSIPACGLRDVLGGTRHRVVAVGWQGEPGGVLASCRPLEAHTPAVRAIGPQLWEAANEGTTRFRCTGRGSATDVLLDVARVTRVVLEAPRRLRVGEIGTIEFHGVGEFGRRLELGALATTTLPAGLVWLDNAPGVTAPGLALVAGTQVRATTPGPARVLGRFGAMAAEATVEIVP